MMKKIEEANFDYNDFLKQSEMIANMGSMSSMIKMMPGMGKISNKQLDDAEKKNKQYKAMISSMTPEERKNPDILAKVPSRRMRIARVSMMLLLLVGGPRSYGGQHSSSDFKEFGTSAATQTPSYTWFQHNGSIQDKQHPMHP